MKKFFKSKKWIAFFLALLLVVSTSITSSDAFLWAAGGQEGNQVNGNAPVNDNETGELEKLEITVPEMGQPAEDPETPPTGDPQTPATGEQSTVDQPVEGNPSNQPTVDQPTEDQPGGDQPTVDQTVVENPDDQPTEDETEEEVFVEKNLMGAALFAARPLAEHSRPLTVGDEIDITCDDDGRWTLHNNWNSSDSNVVEIVRTSGRTAHIKAKNAGDAIITCGTWLGSTHTRWNVTVENPPYTKTDTTHAYGYVGFMGGDPNDQGCMKLIRTIKSNLGNESVDNNGNVWYDLGVVEVQNPALPGLTLPHNAGSNDQPSPNSAPGYVDQVKKIYKTDASKAGLIDMAYSAELTAANGTSASYGVPVVSEGGMLTWHFDVKIDVSNMNYTINYIDTKGNTIKDSSGKIWEKHGTVISGENVAPAIPGYEYVKDPSNSIIIDKGKENQVLTLKYKPANVGYKVEYYYKNSSDTYDLFKTSEKDGFTAGTAEVTDADKMSEKEGYEFDATCPENVLESTISANGNTTLKVYFKPVTDKSYTVHYYREGTTDRLAEDKVESGKTFGRTYTESAVSVNGYKPTKLEDSITIGLNDEENVITFYYTADSATIKFETNGGRVVSDMRGVTDQEITDKAMPETKREGYQFDGWYATKDFTGNKVEQLPENYPAGTTTYYAKWLKEYKIEYYYAQHGNNIYSLEHTETESADIGTTINLSDVEPKIEPNNNIGRYVWNKSKGTLNGTVKEDEELVLQVYFDLEYRVFGEIDANGKIIGDSEFWVSKDGVLSLEQVIRFEANPRYIIESVTVDLSPTLNNGVESTETVKDKSYNYTRTEKINTDIKVTAKTKALNPALSLAKTTANASDNTAFVPGEEIVYTIVVENTGDQPLTNIVVNDSTGFNQTIPGPLEPGESGTFTTTYTVKSEDVNGNGGKVENKVTATANVSGSYAADFPDGVTAEKMVTSLVEVSEPSIAVEITAEDKAYEWDETVTYKITVTNNGNAAIKDIKVTGTLPDLDWEVGTLVPDAKKFWIIKKSVDEKTVDYKVTSADILAGEIYNSVHVSGKDPMDTPVEGDDDVTVRTADIDASYSIVKTLDDYDENKAYAAGETLTYKIKVTNEGNVTLDNIVVTDQLNNTVEGTVKFTKLGGISVDSTDALEAAGLTLNEDNTVTIESLEAKKDLELECEYEITRADAALNTQLKGTDPANAGIRNTASVTAVDRVEPAPESGKDPVDPKGPSGETDPVNTEDRYTLIVQYQYSDGTTASPAHTDYLKAGDTYTVPVPALAGYNSNYAAVTGTMEARNLVITVVYSVPATTGGGGGGEDTPTTPPTPPTLPTLPQPVVVPDTPVPAGAIQVEVPAELVAIGDEEVPLQGARIDIDEDGNAEVVPIDEEEIPLAGMVDSPVLHCILHFLLLLAAVLMFLYHVVSTQRRQKKLDDMRDQLSGR